MILKDFLLHNTCVGDLVVIRENGWQIGMTRIDNEDLFIYSLNPRLLDGYDVIAFSYEHKDWATKEVLIVDILPITEVTENVRKEMTQRSAK